MATTATLVILTVCDAAVVCLAKQLPALASLPGYLASATVVAVDDVATILACLTSATVVVGKVWSANLVDALAAIHPNLNFHTPTSATATVFTTGSNLVTEPVCEHVWQLAVWTVLRWQQFIAVAAVVQHTAVYSDG